MVQFLGRVAVVVGASLLLAGQDPSVGIVPPPPVPATEPQQARALLADTPGLQATQVAVAVDREGSRRRFRATVLQVEDDVVTIFTAAHCISAEDKGWPVALLFGGGVVVEGVVGEVNRNPRYRPNQPREIPGPDNAVARLRFRVSLDPSRPRPEAAPGALAADPLARVAPTRNPAAIEAFRSIQPVAALSTRFFPGPGGAAVAVRVIDGRGVEHALRAGNFSNPRWLEWGRQYQPIPGDSGGGVFVVAPGPTGQPRPILIGIIVGRDDRGGGASLISLGEPWVTDALKPSPRGS